MGITVTCFLSLLTALRCQLLEHLGVTGNCCQIHRDTNSGLLERNALPKRRRGTYTKLYFVLL